LISIARAILANPSILILDEATSSVDTRTEIQIQEALQRLMKDRTSFVIAHRLSTIRKADTVLVVNHGEIVERGSHKELMERKGFYYNLYMSQFKGTIDDADFEYIKPVEVYDKSKQYPMPRMGIGGEQSPELMQKRAMEVIKIFRDKEATSPESAKSIEELGLPPFFPKIFENRLGPLGIIVEKEGLFYLVEENTSKM
jgi:ABC-type multidrug transport system ATPase subunit